ncbi:hypothetical protein IAD21_00580 [Abditibacteriota bacterium]|nr:hypothetical protein IAD21_00580 [Abditibacteriota bacterium]
MQPFKFRTVTRDIVLAGLSPSVDSNISFNRAEAIRFNKLFYNGEHWNDGIFWMGPTPAPNDPTYTDVRTEIKRVFCSRNVISEVTSNQRDGVLGTEPAWSFVRVDEVTEENPLSPKQATFLAEVNDAATSWWDERGITQLLKNCHDEAALGESVSLRLYVPHGRLQKNEKTGAYEVPIGDFAKQMKRIFPQMCLTNQTGSLVETESQTRGMVYFEDRGDKGTWLEIVFPEEDATGRVQTVMRVISTVKGVENETLYSWDLGGRLTIKHLDVDVLITQQVRENQMSINLQKTLQNRNGIAGGFVERLITDGMPPGKYVEDPKDPTKKIYQVAPFRVGAGTTNFIRGAKYEEGEEGKVRYGSPGVHYREPTSPDTFIDAKRDFYQDILEETGQTFTLTNGDANSSGESRKQARQTFKKRLDGVKAAIDPLGRWLLETVVLMALVFANRRTEGDILRCDFACIVDEGPRTADEQRADGEAVKDGRLSVETSMTRDGIEDPAAEINRRNGEREASMEVRKQRAEVMTIFTGAGLDIHSAALAAGFSEEEAGKMVAKAPEPKEPVVT